MQRTSGAGDYKQTFQLSGAIENICGDISKRSPAPHRQRLIDLLPSSSTRSELPGLHGLDLPDLILMSQFLITFILFQYFLRDSFFLTEQLYCSATIVRIFRVH